MVLLNESALSMNIFLIDNSVLIRLGSFALVFIVMAIWEKVAPRRVLNAPKITRWSNNLSITFLNSLAVKFVFPITAIGVALMAAESRLWRPEHYGDIFPLGGINSDYSVGPYDIFPAQIVPCSACLMAASQNASY